MSQQEVLDRLESLNRPTEPYRLIDGRSEGVDLIAEWKIVDAQWCEAFAKSGLSKVFRIYLKLDPANHEVRAIDREYTVEWRAGVPSTLVAVGRFRGQMQSRESSKAYVFTKELGLHEVYNYRFSTKELKGPIQDAVTSCGWTYKGVVFGKL
jgi:hypothetical protein